MAAALPASAGPESSSPDPVRAPRLKQPGWRRGALQKGLGLRPRWVRGAPAARGRAGPPGGARRPPRGASPGRGPQPSEGPNRPGPAAGGDGHGSTGVCLCVFVCISVCLCVFVQRSVCTHALTQLPTICPFFPLRAFYCFVNSQGIICFALSGMLSI